MSPLIPSLAGEIVGADGMTQIGPTARLPIVHHAGFAHIDFEAICLAHRRVGGSPKITRIVCKSGNSSRCKALIVIENLVRSSGVEINKSELSSAQDCLRRSSFCRCGA